MRVLVLLLLALPVAGQEYAILQGATGNGTAQFAVLVPRDAAVQYAVKPGDGKPVQAPALREGIRRADSEWRVDRLTFRGLSPEQDHALLVIRDKGIADRRVFRIPDWSRAKGHIAIASCMDDTYDEEQKAIWPELLAEKPDALMLIGDNAYCDVVEGRLVRPAQPKLLWARHVETRSRLALFRQKHLVPTFTTWDDHDYGENNAGREYPHKRASKTIFRAFFPQEEIDGFLAHGPGVSAAFTLFGQRWLLLDGRTFRSPNRESVPDETVFGPRQEAWIAAALVRREPLWIVSGAQFFGGYHRFESYEACQPGSFARFRKMVADGSAACAFVSGDRHLAEIMKIEDCGFPTYELTTSAIHARTYPDAWKDAENPRKIHGVSGALNYAVLDVEKGARLKAEVRVLGPGRKVHFEQDIDVGRDG